MYCPKCNESLVIEQIELNKHQTFCSRCNTKFEITETPPLYLNIEWYPERPIQLIKQIRDQLQRQNAYSGLYNAKALADCIIAVSSNTEKTVKVKVQASKFTGNFES